MFSIFHNSNERQVTTENIQPLRDIYPKTPTQSEILGLGEHLIPGILFAGNYLNT